MAEVGGVACWWVVVEFGREEILGRGERVVDTWRRESRGRRVA